MAWKMQWFDDDHKILLFTVEKGSTWNDFDIAMNKYSLELAASEKKIHVIIYNEYGFPNSNPLPHIKTQMYKLSLFKNRGLLITVTPEHSASFVLTIAEFVFRFMRLEMKQGVFVKTMDEALARIQSEEMKSIKAEQ